jgi:hypothetical protein
MIDFIINLIKIKMLAYFESLLLCYLTQVNFYTSKRLYFYNMSVVYN